MLARSTEPVAAAPTPVGGGDGGTDSTAESSNEAPLTSGLEGGVVLSDVAVSVSSAPMVSTFGDFGSFSGMSGSAPDRDMLMRFEQKEAQFRRWVPAGCVFFCQSVFVHCRVCVSVAPQGNPNVAKACSAR